MDILELFVTLHLFTYNVGYLAQYSTSGFALAFVEAASIMYI